MTKRQREMTWNRNLWGIELSTPYKRTPFLLGSLWHEVKPTLYHGEPTRAFLFARRSIARKWCEEQNKLNAQRMGACKDWRYRVVRVRETVRKVKQ